MRALKTRLLDWNVTFQPRGQIEDSQQMELNIRKGFKGRGPAVRYQKAGGRSRPLQTRFLQVNTKVFCLRKNKFRKEWHISNFSSFSSSSGSQPLSQNLAPASSGILNFAGVFAASTRKSSESASPLKGKTETPEKGKKGSPFAKPKTPKKTSALEVQKRPS